MLPLIILNSVLGCLFLSFFYILQFNLQPGHSAGWLAPWVDLLSPNVEEFDIELGRFLLSSVIVIALSHFPYWRWYIKKSISEVGKTLSCRKSEAPCLNDGK